MTTEALVGRHLSLPLSGVNMQAIKSGLTWHGEIREQDVLLYTVDATHVHLPRAFRGIVRAGGGPLFHLVDQRPASYPRVEITPKVKLDHVPAKGGGYIPSGSNLQQRAIQALASGQDGGLELYCGAGKTLITLYHQALRKVPMLVVVDNEPLLEQWMAQAERHFIREPGSVGIWKGKKEEWKRGTVFTTYQTLSRRAEGLTEEQRRWFGIIAFDEGHHLSAEGYSTCAGAFYGQRLNITATPERADGAHQLTLYHMGGSLYQDLKPPIKSRNILLWTGTKTLQAVTPSKDPWASERNLARISAMLSCDASRRERVIKLLRQWHNEGDQTLVLTRSLVSITNHLFAWYGLPAPVTNPKDLDQLEERPELLAGLLSTHKDVGVLAREVNKSDRSQAADKDLIFSITKFGREGFDSPRLRRVLLLEPVSDAGLLQQILGRVSRPYPGKLEAETYALIDDHPQLIRMAKTTKTNLLHWPEYKGGPLHFAKGHL